MDPFLYFMSSCMTLSASCRSCTLAVWCLNIVCEVVTSVTCNIEKLVELTPKLSTQCVTLTCTRLQSTFYSLVVECNREQ